MYVLDGEFCFLVVKFILFYLWVEVKGILKVRECLGFGKIFFRVLIVLFLEVVLVVYLFNIFFNLILLIFMG